MTDKQKMFFEAVNKWLNKMGEEAKTQKEFVRWFKASYPNSIIYHVPNGIDCKNGVDRYVRKCLGVEAGVPDLHIIHNKQSLFIEFKTLKGILSDEQKKMIGKFEMAGIPVFVCYSFAEAVNVILNLNKNI